jgi:preprotein translocase subunit SecE
MQKFIQYLKDVRAELAKVSWPTRDEVIGATTLVVIVSVVVGLFVKAFDFALSRVLGFLLNM